MPMRNGDRSGRLAPFTVMMSVLVSGPMAAVTEPPACAHAPGSTIVPSTVETAYWLADASVGETYVAAVGWVTAEREASSSTSYVLVSFASI